MKTLILKLGATGDVVRTTPLLERLGGEVTWITARNNAPLLEGIGKNLRCLTWENRDEALDTEYDMAINLEDTLDVAQFLARARTSRIFGAYATPDCSLKYTDDSRMWFDLSLISSFGREAADRLKYQNRRTYQEMIFEGLGLKFDGEPYLLPQAVETDLSGDVAIAADAGPVWPMKKWAYYDQLKHRLESDGLVVNVLPRRASLLEHLGDIANHRCLVGGDSLPMHLALGTGTNCVSLFTCTSPWEIYGYDIQEKIVSPLLGQFFYQRGYDERATTAIGIEQVYGATLRQLGALPKVASASL